jgi:hypothetical protein
VGKRNQGTAADTQTIGSFPDPSVAASIERPNSRPLFLWVALLLGGVVFGCYAFGAWIIVRPSAIPKTFGWDAVMHRRLWIVSGVDPSGPAAGKLHNGDRLLAFNEDRRAEQIGPELFMYFLPPGSTYTVRVWRNPAEPDDTIALNFPNRRSYGFMLWRAWELIQGLIVLSLGLFMVWLRPDYRVARQGSAMFLVWSLRTLYLALEPYGGAGLGASSILIPGLWWVSENWIFGFAYHFVLRFFGNVLKERFWSVLVFLAYAICELLSVVNGVWLALLFRGFATATALVSQHTKLLNVRDALANQFRHSFEAGAVLLTVAALVFGYRRVQDSDQRRRVRWFVFGTVLAEAPFFAVAGFFLVLDAWRGTPAGAQQWGARLTPASYGVIAIPFFWTYAVVRHRVLGIDVVIRQGVQYLLARNVLRVILVLPIIGLVLPIVLHPNRPLTEAFSQNSLYLNLTLLIALSASIKYRKQLGASVDRRFFREAHDQERVLNKLIEQIGEFDSLADISALISQQLMATMHPDGIWVFYRETARSELRLRYRSSSGLEMGPALADNLHVLRLARETRTPLDSSALDRAVLPGPERDWLHDMGAHLVVPIGLTNQPPAGLLVMGGKRSEEPYGPADLKLLQGIAAQMAVVYERIWLREQVEVDRRLRNEVFAHVDARSVDLLKECPTCGVCYDNRDQECVHDGGQLIHTLPVARTIESRYRLDLRIGHGGMGAVFEATDLRLHRKVAIKVLVGRLFGNLAALRRFEREAEACARLIHPNIVVIHDFGRIGQEGAYLVMDRLNGRTLRSELKSSGKLPPVAAAEWFNQFLNGLQAAHGAGIAHRDLKPENVFITPLETGGDRITILDFGLAKLNLEESAEKESLTMPGTVMGTMGYMSPEQLSGQSADERSDLFSTGVIIFEGITGSLPFKATNYADILRAMSQGSPTVPGDSTEIVGLNRVLRRCLASNLSERFQTATELQSEVVPALRSWSNMKMNNQSR